MKTILALDQNLFIYLNNNFHLPILNIFFNFFNMLGTWWLLAPICLFFIYLYDKKNITYWVILLFLCAITSGLILHFLKWYIERPRPLREFELLINQGKLIVYVLGEKLNGKNSFPSGHTQAAFTGATFLYCFFKKQYSFLIFFMAFLVGIARVYSGAHFPCDVIGGIVIGVVPTVIVIKYYKCTIIKI